MLAKNPKKYDTFKEDYNALGEPIKSIDQPAVTPQKKLKIKQFKLNK